MQYMKIRISTSSGTRTIATLFYKDWWVFLKCLPNIHLSLLPEGPYDGSLPKGLRVYWIDEDTDEIEITGYDSYDYFRSHADLAKRKLYIEEEEVQTSGAPRSERRHPKGPARTSELAVHENIVCDGCDKKPIVGFRYKCAECVDYDLCGDCEAKGKHSEHVMFRLPTLVKGASFDTHTCKRLKRKYPLDNESAEDTPSRHGHANEDRPTLSTLSTDLPERTEGPLPVTSFGEISKSSTRYRASTTDVPSASINFDSYFNRNIRNSESNLEEVVTDTNQLETNSFVNW